jgi:PAS domain S-box-containing protein
MTHLEKKEGSAEKKEESSRSERDSAEKKMARSQKIPPGHKEQTPAALIQELQIHQIELETQAEELRRAQLELEESRDKYIDLYEFAPLGYLMLTDKAEITEVNITGASLLGAPRSRLKGAGFITFVAPEDHDQWARYFMNVLQQGNKLTCHLLLMTREDGSVFPAQLEGIRITGSSGVTSVRIAINDITDIRQVEEALEASEERFRFAMSYLPGTLWTIDNDLRFTLSQGSGLAALGLGPDQVVGTSLYDFFKTKDPGDTAISAHLRALHGEVVTYEYEHKGLFFRSIVAPMREPQGKITGVVGIAFDITGTRQIEEALHKSNKKIHHLSGITRHDINNQLTVMRGYLTLLEKLLSNPAFNEYFLKVSTAAQRISTMIQFTKEYDQIGVNSPVWQDCRTLVDTAVIEVALGKIQVIPDIPAGTEVFADPLIDKVFYNLMDNAVRYGGKISTLQFSAQESGDNLVFVCEDDGEGVAEEEKEKIFERGFGKNTGLGLFLSREILETTGITIRETGEHGKGARFEITAPKGMWRITGTERKGE